MDYSIAIKTDLFEHRKVKSTFINPCCFGEDFALWLTQELASLSEKGFVFSKPIQEDYGWGFCVSHRKDHFWIALSYVGDGPQEEPAEWVVSVSKPGFVAKLLHRSESQRASEELRDHIWELLESNAAVQVIEPHPDR